jgi:hypothetical protein
MSINSCRKGERLDWMYQGGLAAKEDAAKRADEHLLGKPGALTQSQQLQEVSKCEAASNLPSFTASASVAQGQNEAWARLNHDPLLMIKKRQQDQLKALRENPVQMQKIIEEVQAKRKEKKEKKDKKEKKHKKDKSHHRRYSSEDGSDDDAARRERERERSPGRVGERERGSERGSERERHDDDHQDRPRQQDGYGLSHSRAIPQEYHERSALSGQQRANETRTRIEEALKRKEEEERALAAKRHQRRDYRPGQMSEEDKRRRLEEMMGNASAHERQRDERVKRAEEAAEANEGKVVTNAGGVTGREGDAFASAASRDVFKNMMGNGSGSIEARISSRVHYNSH